ncbi:MAG: ester cyclase [Alphaproteobacteria bacterium]
MDDAATRALIQQLLASEAVWDDTKDELKTYLAELDRGELDADDRAYVEKMAARLDGKLPDTVDDEPDDDWTAPADLVRRFYEDVWNKADEAAARELLHAEFRFRASLGPEMTGPDGFIDYMRAVHAALADFTCVVDGMLEEHGEAAARLSFHGTHQGTLFGVEATGNRVEWTGAAFFDTDGQQITALWVLGDVDAVKRQIGAAIDADF